MKIHFHFAAERFDELTLDASMALSDLERGVEPDPRGMRDIMAPFMQNESGEWLDEKQANALLGRVKRKELAAVFKQFHEAMRDYMLPKVIGINSTQPSGTEPAAQPG